MSRLRWWVRALGRRVPRRAGEHAVTQATGSIAPLPDALNAAIDEVRHRRLATSHIANSAPSADRLLAPSGAETPCCWRPFEPTDARAAFIAMAPTVARALSGCADRLRSPGQEVLGRSRRPVGPRDSFEAGRPGRTVACTGWSPSPSLRSPAPSDEKGSDTCAAPAHSGNALKESLRSRCGGGLQDSECLSLPRRAWAWRFRRRRRRASTAPRTRAARARLSSCGAARSARARRSLPTAGGRTSRRSTTPRPARSSTSTTTSRRWR